MVLIQIHIQNSGFTNLKKTSNISQFPAFKSHSTKKLVFCHISFRVSNFLASISSELVSLKGNITRRHKYILKLADDVIA